MTAIRCLITGGAGFIGHGLAKFLQAAGHMVTILDMVPPEAGRNNSVSFIRGSTLETDLVHSLVADHDVIFHLAALLGVQRTLIEPVPMIENNVLGTMNILKSAFQEGKKVIFASTSEVYGKGRSPFSEHDDLSFGPTTKIRWSYAIAKSLEEHLCLGYSRKGLPVTIVRYFNVYGPGQKDGVYGGVVARFIRAALQGKDITVYGDGKQTRCFTYVSDAAEATFKALSRTCNKQVLNIGSSDEMTIYDLAQLIKEVTGSQSRIVRIPYTQAYPDGFEEIPQRVPDIGKLYNILGFRPKISMEEGLNNTAAWLRKTLAGRAGEVTEDDY